MTDETSDWYVIGENTLPDGGSGIRIEIGGYVFAVLWGSTDE